MENQIRKDYPLTGVLKPMKETLNSAGITNSHQEGLPAYWGIETKAFSGLYPDNVISLIRKDYPLTGVLKLELSGDAKHRRRCC